MTMKKKKFKDQRKETIRVLKHVESDLDVRQKGKFEDLQPVGRFILTTIASSVWVGDYKRVIKNTNINFSCTDNSPLFEGTFLRFRAYAYQVALGKKRNL